MHYVLGCRHMVKKAAAKDDVIPFIFYNCPEMEECNDGADGGVRGK